MTLSIQITTDFDCRSTGVTGHYRENTLPFTDQLGQSVTDIPSWVRSRNQQRNWETIMQLISLYTQPVRVSPVRVRDHRWQFTFDTEFDDVFAVNDDPVGRLLQACDGVPIINYVEQQLTTLLHPGVNIWFESLNHK